ncbi:MULTISPECIES: hypothetical protein [unclassified Frankia]|uniref:hypothetical protein n=1 Tax=unclassified Frankia TaxID=2632575 RepID=UPI002AD48AE0|nr:MULTISPECIES: hypothetical protein [unclassified Frankia]
MAVCDTVLPDYLTRFTLGVVGELIEGALVEWDPDRTTNLRGAGCDGTEIELLDEEACADIEDFLLHGIGDIVALARRLGDRAPTPEDLGRDYVLSRQGAGVGLWDRGYGPEGDRLHAQAQAYGDIVLEVAGQEDDCDSWTFSLL